MDKLEAALAILRDLDGGQAKQAYELLEKGIDEVQLELSLRPYSIND